MALLLELKVYTCSLSVNDGGQCEHQTDEDSQNHSL